MKYLQMDGRFFMVVIKIREIFFRDFGKILGFGWRLLEEFEAVYVTEVLIRVETLKCVEVILDMGDRFARNVEWKYFVVFFQTFLASKFRPFTRSRAA